MIRKHEVRILVAISVALSVVIAVVAMFGPYAPSTGSTPQLQDAMAMGNVKVVVTGPAERTAGGHAIPINVTNERDGPISVTDMVITVILTDITRLSATCVGPDSIAPGATERFRVLVDEPGDIEVFVIDLVKGDHYLRCVMPTWPAALPLPDVPKVIVPDDPPAPPSEPEVNEPPEDDTTPDPQPEKVEPVVCTLLSSDLPLRPAYYEASPPVYGEAAAGRVDTWVEEHGDPTRIAVYIHMAGLSPDQVGVAASYGGGVMVPAALVSDGAGGCRGLLIDAPAAGGSNWTWAYDGAGGHHNISLSVTTHVLGTHEVRFYAYDADTGKAISEVESTSYTVYGNGGVYGTARMFDTVMSSDLADPFIPGSVYNLTFEDTCRYDSYRGTVRSVFTCPYAVSVWVVNDGEETLLTPDGSGEYVVSWQHEAGTTHQLHLRVQLGEADGTYPPAVGRYWLEDAATGMIVSAMDGAGAGMTFTVRGPEEPL
ncbi:MAG: hypothetical protein ISF22_10815 [Methanomassiliicoccus sp.]|nr:hypothetical protein [Methanomassiliicoccus sp.]